MNATGSAAAEATETAVDIKARLRRTARAERRKRVGGWTEASRDRAALAIADAAIGVVEALAGGDGDARLKVAAYQSLPHEPPTEALIARLLQAGHQVLVPITLPDFSLEWTDAANGSLDGVVGVGTHATVTRRELTEDEEVLGVDALAECDLVIAPALLIDARGVRLGQGGGCYDRALSWTDSGTPVVALVHDGEVIDGRLPRDPHDQPVDAVLTTSGTLSWFTTQHP